MTATTRVALHESVLDLVGGTPLVRLRRLVDDGAARVYAKLEHLNPGGSVKDRAASSMVAAAESAGLLWAPVNAVGERGRAGRCPVAAVFDG